MTSINIHRGRLDKPYSIFQLNVSPSEWMNVSIQQMTLNSSCWRFFSQNFFFTRKKKNSHNFSCVLSYLILNKSFRCQYFQLKWHYLQLSSKQNKLSNKLLWKMSIQYPALGFKLMTFCCWIYQQFWKVLNPSQFPWTIVPCKDHFQPWWVFTSPFSKLT